MRISPAPFAARQLNGLWRSLVARLHGVQEAVGSNPASPTIYQRWLFFTFSLAGNAVVEPSRLLDAVR